MTENGQRMDTKLKSVKDGLGVVRLMVVLNDLSNLNDSSFR